MEINQFFLKTPWFLLFFQNIFDLNQNIPDLIPDQFYSTE